MSIDALQRAALARMARVDAPPYDLRTGDPYKLVRMRVVSRTDGQVIPNGHLVNEGETFVEVYENQVDAVLALVDPATDEELQRVRADLEWHTSECMAGRNDRRSLPSLPASYRHVLKREMLPFTEAEVLAKRGGRKTAEG